MYLLISSSERKAQTKEAARVNLKALPTEGHIITFIYVYSRIIE